MKIKSGDNVIVITGKDKGKTGKVSRLFLVKIKSLLKASTKRSATRSLARKARSQGQIIESRTQSMFPTSRRQNNFY
jgi:ribosomal protein L24